MTHCVTLPSLSTASLLARFPIADLRSGQERLPWWRRSLRREVALLELTDATLSSTLGAEDAARSKVPFATDEKLVFEEIWLFGITWLT